MYVGQQVVPNTILYSILLNLMDSFVMYHRSSFVAVYDHHRELVDVPILKRELSTTGQLLQSYEMQSHHHNRYCIALHRRYE